MKILIIVHSPTWFTELSTLGRYIHTLPAHQVAIHIINYQHWTINKFAADLRREGIACTVEGEEVLANEAAGRVVQFSIYGRVRNRLAKAGKRMLRRLSPTIGYDFVDNFGILSGAVADAGALAQTHKPDVVVLGGDNPGYTTPALIKGFKKAGVPTVIVSSTMSNGLEEAAVYSVDTRYHVAGRLAQLVAAARPKWVLEYGGIKLLRCPVGRVLALEALRMAPPEPWIFNSGYADAIAMESEAMVEYYVRAGLPRSRMKLTGSPSDDVMAKINADAPLLREALYTELRLPAGRPMLLTALVPDFLYVTGGRPQCDFKKYYTLIDFWIKSLADQKTFNVVVALHPHVKIETMRYLERPNVRIAPRRTAELVPLCDLYVASISSTIRWAIACGKPVINYDVYRYRYTDFLGIPGIAATEEKEEFCALIKRFADDPAYLEEMTLRQRSQSHRWGILDGNSSRRVVELLVATADAKEATRP